MGRHAEITKAWADGDYVFRLDAKRTGELEENLDAGASWLVGRMLYNRDRGWRQKDVRETIRLGLIGGGTAPSKALALVARYVNDRPSMESLPLAIEILMASLSGQDAAELGKATAAEAGDPSPAGNSTGPPFTETAPP